jgi:RNA polymerase sigma factor (sigma-70 family)
MKQALSIAEMADEQDQRITETVAREEARLRNFIRRRAPEGVDAEDILQDVFSEFVEAYRLMKPIEQAGAWLFRVARNRIIDLFRKRKLERMPERPLATEDRETFSLEELLPSADGGPEQAYVRSVLLEEIEDALDELPKEQREVFVAHEMEGRSFKELAAETGVSVNTLLSRKHYAVMHLRQRLRGIYEELSDRTRR